MGKMRANSLADLARMAERLALTKWNAGRAARVRFARHGTKASSRWMREPHETRAVRMPPTAGFHILSTIRELIIIEDDASMRRLLTRWAKSAATRCSPSLRHPRFSPAAYTKGACLILDLGLQDIGGA